MQSKRVVATVRTKERSTDIFCRSMNYSQRANDEIYVTGTAEPILVYFVVRILIKLLF